MLRALFEKVSLVFVKATGLCFQEVLQDLFSQAFLDHAGETSQKEGSESSIQTGLKGVLTVNFGEKVQAPSRVVGFMRFKI